MLIWYKAVSTISLKYNFLLPWYSWKITQQTLSNDHPITYLLSTTNSEKVQKFCEIWHFWLFKSPKVWDLFFFYSFLIWNDYTVPSYTLHWEMYLNSYKRLSTLIIIFIRYFNNQLRSYKYKIYDTFFTLSWKFSQRIYKPN